MSFVLLITAIVGINYQCEENKLVSDNDDNDNHNHYCMNIADPN